MDAHIPPRDLSNPALVAGLHRLAQNERYATARVIEYLEEFDQRRLYLSEGSPSLFAYCVTHLHLCEYAAYARIEIARASRRFPELLNRFRSGSLTLTNAGLLAPHLTDQNLVALLDEAHNKRKEDVKAIIARLKPKPPAPALVRKVAVPQSRVNADPASASILEIPPSEGSAPMLAAAPPAPQVRRPVVAPLSADHYRLQLTITRETRDKLREVQNLVRHAIPDADAAAIFDRAISLLLAELRKKKLGLSARPRAKSREQSGGSRHILAGIKREVAVRDNGQCAFVGRRGRCPERGFLEFHHVVPFAAAGKATVDNIQLRCRAHNAHEAVLYFGEEVMAGARGAPE